MHGLIAAAGLSTRLQDLADRNNKVLLDIGGDTLLGNLLTRFAEVGVEQTHVVVGFGAQAVRTHVGTRAHGTTSATRPTASASTAPTIIARRPVSI